jgi:hypothetical protein
MALEAGSITAALRVLEFTAGSLRWRRLGKYQHFHIYPPVSA